MANYNSNLHPENDTGSVVFPNINGQSIPENAVTPSKVAAGQFPQIVAGAVQNPLTIVTAEGQTNYDGSGAATIDISSIQTADHAYTADRATSDGEGNNIPATYAKQDGDYETLGAGYLSRYGFVNASAQAWYKIANVDIAQVGLQNNSYSAKILINGVHATQQYAYPNKSGTLEMDIRYDAGTIVSDQTGLIISSGNIDTDDYCVTIDGSIVTLYAHMPYQYAQTTFTVVQESYENTPIAELLNFNIQNVGTSAPSGAKYATVKNGADHLVLPAAVGSTTTPVYFNADGVPQPCALPVSKYYNHTFTYQPSKLVQTSDFSFIFSVVLDVATPIPAGNTVLWGAYLNLPQTSLAPMPSNSKFFPATGIIKQDGQVGHIMGVGLAAQPLGVNLIASIYYEYNGTTGVYPASNSHVVLDPDRISESVVTP